MTCRLPPRPDREEKRGGSRKKRQECHHPKRAAACDEAISPAAHWRDSENPVRAQIQGERENDAIAHDPKAQHEDGGSQQRYAYLPPGIHRSHERQFRIRGRRLHEEDSRGEPDAQIEGQNDAMLTAA